jgi:hypothetical protein
MTQQSKIEFRKLLSEFLYIVSQPNIGQGIVLEATAKLEQFVDNIIARDVARIVAGSVKLKAE